MKQSRILVFYDPVESNINKEIEKYEEDRWEVVDQKIAVAKSTFSTVVLSVLLQREKIECI